MTETPIIDALMQMRYELMKHAPGREGVVSLISLGAEAGRALERELVKSHMLNAVRGEAFTMTRYASIGGIRVEWPT